jgi:hypothetical protein
LRKRRDMILAGKVERGERCLRDQLGAGAKVRRPVVWIAGRRETSHALASELHAKAQETHGAAADIQGCVPPPFALAKENDGAPGVDGVTFEAIEAHGVEVFLEQIRDELVGRTYKPLPARRQEIPKDGGKVRVLSIPAIRDRVVQPCG